MPSNDQIILGEILKQRRNEVASDLSESEFFELFTAEQVLKDFDLSYNELESGVIGDGGDGGIDGIYLFVNGELAQEDPDYSHLRREITIELMVIQSKTRSGFQETPIERFITISDDILDLSKDPNNLSATYNSALVEAIKLFRTIYQQLSGKFPSLRLTFTYSCQGKSPNRRVKRKVDTLNRNVARLFPSAKFRCDFLGASELLTLARRAPKTTYTLKLAENPISSGGQVGFACLVKLPDFYEFITDDRKDLHRQIFDANVRDYQGPTEVNDEIRRSLQKNNPEDFWWLNNGVSIVASKASLGGKTLTIEDPQIVNGLQTSTEIYKYFSNLPNTNNDDRNVLVRVIVPEEAASRDRIIKATNSQTAVQQASLRATDKIHRDIEEYLRPRGLYYDRRKNFYKNESKPRNKIIGIPHLAQSIMAVVLQRPDTARARPSSLLKRDEDYRKVYNSAYPIALYHVCAEGMRRIEAFLRSPHVDLTTKDRSNLRFYVAMHSLVSLTGKRKPSPNELANVDINKLDDVAIKNSLDLVCQQYTALGGTDQIAKGPYLLAEIRKLM